MGLAHVGRGRIFRRKATPELFEAARVVSCARSEIEALVIGFALEAQIRFLRLARCSAEAAAATVDRADQDVQRSPRPRRLLAHRREIHKLEKELTQRGTTLVPLAIYFKDGRAKVEIGVARGKQQHDKRDTIRKKEQDRELRRAMSQRR